jgi:predicted XRE-type DNA-binding protein
MKREALIKEISLNYIKRRGLSQSKISSYTSDRRGITQLEEMELELGTVSNFRLNELHKQFKNS